MEHFSRHFQYFSFFQTRQDTQHWKFILIANFFNYFHVSEWICDFLIIFTDGEQILRSTFLMLFIFRNELIVFRDKIDSLNCISSLIKFTGSEQMSQSNFRILREQESREMENAKCLDCSHTASRIIASDNYLIWQCDLWITQIFV